MEPKAIDVDAQSASVTLVGEIVSQEAESHIDHILSLYDSLSRKTDLRPCASINAMFGELVGLCIQTLSQGVTQAASHPLHSTYDFSVAAQLTRD
jgi:hypothetical protein